MLRLVFWRRETCPSTLPDRRGDSVTSRDPVTTSLKTSFQELIPLRPATGGSHPIGFEYSIIQPNIIPRYKPGYYVWRTSTTRLEPILCQKAEHENCTSPAACSSKAVTRPARKTSLCIFGFLPPPIF